MATSTSERACSRVEAAAGTAVRAAETIQAVGHQSLMSASHQLERQRTLDTNIRILAERQAQLYERQRRLTEYREAQVRALERQLEE